MMQVRQIALASIAAVLGTFQAGAMERPARTQAAEDASGRVIFSAEGKSSQLRFKGWPTEDFSAYPTHAYSRTGRAVPVQSMRPPQGRTGDPDVGRRVWQQAPCVNCHTLPDATVSDSRWAGTLGPTLGGYGLRGHSPAYTYQIIYDARSINRGSIMPPWGSAGILSSHDILNLVAFLHSLKDAGTIPGGLAQDPALRSMPVNYFGDNLDPTRNPAALLAENGMDLWVRKGDRQRSCATCHGKLPGQRMGAASATFPRFMKRYGRVLSLEDFLSVHGVEIAGVPLPVESQENLRLAMFIKMHGSGQSMQIHLDDPQSRAAWQRGRETFNKRVGQRNHACADCHSHEQAAGKWLGGRYLGRADVTLGLTRGYPAWRTSFGEVWGLRRRIQWCMLPHGTNNLSADSVEYAELELYLASFDHGKPMDAPGLKD